MTDPEHAEQAFARAYAGGPERHRQKAADDNVFTQFYPVLRAAPRK